MSKDKDELYAEVVYLKDQINKFTQEVYDLKTKVRFTQRENSKMQTVVESVGGYLQQKHEGDRQDTNLMNKLGISENLLTLTLKKQIKELKKEIKQQAAEISELKHVTKYTRFVELDEEIKLQHIELLRLRTMLDQSQRNQAIMAMTHDFNQYEEKFHIQMQIINSLKQENTFLQGQIRLAEEDSFKLQNQIDADQKVMRKQVLVVDDQAQTLKEKTSLIDRLLQELDTYKDTNQTLLIKNNKLDNNQLRIINLVKIEQELRKELQQKVIDIEYLDRTNNELKLKLNNKSSFEAKEKENLQQELQKVKGQYEELYEKYQHMILINAQSKLRETVPTIPRQQQTITAKQQKPNVSDSMPEKGPQKFRIITLEDVKYLGQEINFRLRLKKITVLDAIDKYLFDNKNKKSGEVKLKDISERLQRDPFLLIDEDSALLVARYLVEDNNQEFVIYNDQLTQQIGIVRSVLTKLVGPLTILSPEEEQIKIKEITQAISKYRNSLKQHFDQCQSKYEGLLTHDQIQETFEYMDIELTQQQWDFLFLQLFHYSNNIQIFPYLRIFEIFQEQVPPKPAEKKKKSMKESIVPQTGQVEKSSARVAIFTRRQTQEYM